MWRYEKLAVNFGLPINFLVKSTPSSSFRRLGGILRCLLSELRNPINSRSSSHTSLKFRIPCREYRLYYCMFCAANKELSELRDKSRGGKFKSNLSPEPVFFPFKIPTELHLFSTYFLLQIKARIIEKHVNKLSGYLRCTTYHCAPCNTFASPPKIQESK